MNKMYINLAMFVFLVVVFFAFYKSEYEHTDKMNKNLNATTGTAQGPSSGPRPAPERQRDALKLSYIDNLCKQESNKNSELYKICFSK